MKSLISGFVFACGDVDVEIAEQYNFKDRGQLTRRQRNYNYLLDTLSSSFRIRKQKLKQLYQLKLKKNRMTAIGEDDDLDVNIAAPTEMA
ncbi:hypothetical protein QE152_g34019 [Popillia japonica]|uniref:Uncharacterized protein n=1 Tax=Popillia japonica TaxID=7064 RepID=A0AAW1IUU8_POPJA